MTDTQNINGQKYHVVIDSIGSANPSASKMLSDILGTPVEMVVKALYNTPTVLFSNIEKPLANQCHELLQTLGMEARVQPVSEPLPEKKVGIDVGIYIHDVTKLPKVANELGLFLGCSLQDSLNLLMTDPCVVMGGVSPATAEALCNRLDVEVIISDPKKDLYTLFIHSEDKNSMLIHKLKSHLKHLKIPTKQIELGRIVNLDYSMAQSIWTKYQSTGLLKMSNQSFQRFEINLDKVDTSNEAHKKVLTEEVGMPENIISEILENLPIQLESSANGQTVAEKIKRYREAGLNCSAHIIKPNNYQLVIEENVDLENSQRILSQYLTEEQLPKDTNHWKSPVPLGDLTFRCIAAELEQIGCTVDYEYFSK